VLVPRDRVPHSFAVPVVLRYVRLRVDDGGSLNFEFSHKSFGPTSLKTRFDAARAIRPKLRPRQRGH